MVGLAGANSLGILTNPSTPPFLHSNWDAAPINLTALLPPTPSLSHISLINRANMDTIHPTPPDDDLILASDTQVYALLATSEAPYFVPSPILVADMADATPAPNTIHAISSATHPTTYTPIVIIATDNGLYHTTLDSPLSSFCIPPTAPSTSFTALATSTSAHLAVATTSGGAVLTFSLATLSSCGNLVLPPSSLYIPSEPHRATLSLANVDGNADLDIIWAGSTTPLPSLTSTLGWIRNLGNRVFPSSLRPISDPLPSPPWLSVQALPSAANHNVSDLVGFGAIFHNTPDARSFVPANRSENGEVAIYKGPIRYINVLLEDLSGDNWVDVFGVRTLVAQWFSGPENVQPFLIEGHYVGPYASTYMAPPKAVDLNRDGWLDLIMSAASVGTFYLPNLGQGAFGEAVEIDKNVAVAHIASGSLDHKPGIDLLIPTESYPWQIYLYSDESPDGSGYYNPDNATWIPDFSAQMDNDYTIEYLEVVDFDLDQVPDIVVGGRSWASDPLYLFRRLNASSMVLETGISLMPTNLANPGFDTILIAPWNADNTLDIVFHNYFDVYFLTNALGGGTADTDGVYLSCPFNPQVIDSGDMNGDGLPDLLVAKSSDAPIVFLNTGASANDGINTPFGNGYKIITDFEADIALGLLQDNWFAIADMDADGDDDLIIVDYSFRSIRWLPVYSKDMFYATPPRLLAWDPSLPQCAEGQTTISCLRANMGRTSRCVADTLYIPPGVYQCSSRHIPITASVKLVGMGPSPSDVVFDCQASRVLFQVAGEGTRVELQSMTLSRLGIDAAVSRGSPGLQVIDSATLVMDRVSVLNSVATAIPDLDLFDAGLGGGVLVRSGATLITTDTLFDACSASVGGGAVALVGQDSTFTALSGTRITNCVSAVDGGAVFVSEGGVLNLHGPNVVFSSNTALAGSGGAVFAETLSSLLLEGTDVVLSSNSATSGYGGGIGLRPGARIELEPGVRIENNLAKLGGGLGVLSGRAETITSLDSIIDLDYSLVLDSPFGAEPDQGLWLDGVTFAGNVAVLYGGGMALCGDERPIHSFTNVVWGDGNQALAGGGLSSSQLIFACASNVVDLGGHGPPSQLAFVNPPLSTVYAGGSLGGEIRVSDVWGSHVSYTAMAIRLSIQLGPDTRITEVFEEFDFEVDSLTGLGQVPSVSIYARKDLDEPVDEYTGVTTWELGPAVSAFGAASQNILSGMAGSLTVSPCGPGYGGVASGTDDNGENILLCGPCPQGLHKAGTSFGPCVVIVGCPITGVNVAPPNASLPECVCRNGFMFAGPDPLDTSGLELPLCVPCPVGGVCFQGTGPPYAATGFFGTDNTTFLRCLRPAACPGGPECAPGYEGYLCNLCSPGFYSNSLSECVECPPAGYALLIAGCIAILFMGVVAAAISVVMHSRLKETFKDWAQGSRTRQRGSVPASLSMVVVAVQVVALLGQAKLGWPSEAKRVFRTLSFFNVDVNLFASECTLDSFHVKYAFSVCIPFAVVGTALISMFVLRSKMEGVEVGAMADRMFFTIAPLLYIPCARATLILFDCSKLPNGDIVLDVDPGVPCYDTPWWRVMPIGVVGAICFVIGTPAYFIFCTMRVRTTLLDPATYGRYGPIYRLFRVRFYYYGVADLVKRLGIVLAAIFLSNHQIPQLGMLLFILLGWSFCLAHFRPYFFPLYNRVDLQLTLVLVAIVACGAASHAQRNSREGLWITSGLVIALFILIGIAITSVVMDVFQIRKTRKGTYDAGKERFEEALEDLEDENVGHLMNDIVPSTSTRADIPTAHTLWYGADAPPPSSDGEEGEEGEDGGGGGEEVGGGDESVNLWHGNASKETVRPISTGPTTKTGGTPTRPTKGTPTPPTKGKKKKRVVKEGKKSSTGSGVRTQPSLQKKGGLGRGGGGNSLWHG